MAGGRKSKPPATASLRHTLVLDNGAHTIKAGLVAPGLSPGPPSNPPPRVIPNCLARDRYKKIYVASEIERCADFGEIQFRRPVDKGFIVNWEAQKAIWDHEFFDDGAPLQCDPTETRLILTEAPNALPALQSNCDQIVFEEYQFSSYYRGIGPTFNAYHDVQGIFQTPREPPAPLGSPAEILLVIDCGYSHTTVTPMLAGRPIHRAVRRLDIGGKIMTNHLTRLLSLRHFDMRSDTHTVNEIKEAACYVSHNFKHDLELCWKGTRGETREAYTTGGGIAKDYILPDFHTRSKGILIDYDPAKHSRSRKATTLGGRDSEADEDLVTLRNERFTVPETLFHPSDIGLRQCGLADLVMHSLAELPVGLWPGLLVNIVVVGGCALLPGLTERLQQEIMQRAPDECEVRVGRQDDPVVSTWLGAANLANHGHIEKLAVTKQEYDENGVGWVGRKLTAGLEFLRGEQ